MCQMPARRAERVHRAQILRRDSTAPVGLLGEIVTIARVRGVMAASMASRSELIARVGRDDHRPARRP